MSEGFAIEIAQEALWVAVLIAGPLLLGVLAVGLVIGMFQAATQINEQTMSFVPKLGILALLLFIMAPWLMSVITDFTNSLFVNIPDWIR